MIEKLAQKEVQEFILGHEHDDEKVLVLKHKTILGLPASLIAEQISARRKAKSKLPLYYTAANIIYPPGLNLEQSSSERTALFKSEIITNVIPSRNTVADVTGGLGIDTFFLSKAFKQAYHVEPNSALQKIAAHNHSLLGAQHIVYKTETAEEFISSSNEKLDCVFIDPSRRSAGQKVFKLSDCEPNIVELLPRFFERSNYVLIKTSPLLDIQNGLSELQGVEKVWVVSVDNECKELLFFCNKSFHGEAEIIAVNLSDKNQHDFRFTFSKEKSITSTFSEPLNFIYEPNASILKAGAFKSLGELFYLNKIQTNTHLYTSSDLVADFPGRVFQILGSVKDGKEIREIFKEGKANVITRNYPLSPEQLKKKLKLNDGGDLYLLAFSGEKKKFMLACNRVR
jgi:16S rRNA G966 N2-methylase RsmD